MSSLLLRHIDCLVTLDAERRTIVDGALRVEDGVIVAVGRTAELAGSGARVLDGRNLLVMPGLINTHHHLMQALTRNLPAVQDQELFGWLRSLYEVWREVTPEAAYVSALVGFSELLLSGCTTTADHHYFHPRGTPPLVDEQVRAAREIGIRFHVTRGSMSVGRSRGGLPPDDCVEDEEVILEDCERVIRTFHDPSPRAMVRVALAPCSPFSVSPELMRETRRLATRHRVRLHTHLAETKDEESYCQERWGKRPLAFMEELGWLDRDVWFAHAIHLDAQEVERLAGAGAAVAHCPTSNLRLGSGYAPLAEMLRAGVTVSLGVDGSASNDSSHMFAELRQAFLAARGRYGVSALTARQALELGTLGGARALGRDDLGSLEPGKAADFIGVRLDQLGFAGALHDPVGALVFCGVPRVELSVVGGELVVERGAITRPLGAELPAQHNAIAREMVRRAEARTGLGYLDAGWAPLYG
jgi:8-oxoguanine deaminase